MGFWTRRRQVDLPRFDGIEEATGSTCDSTKARQVHIKLAEKRGKVGKTFEETSEFGVISTAQQLVV
jgi:hypothetical protein